MMRLRVRQALVADRTTAADPIESPARNSGSGTNSMKRKPPGALNAMSSGKALANP